MEPERNLETETDDIGDMPNVGTRGYRKNFNNENKMRGQPCQHRKDSVVSVTPSVNSTAKLIYNEKLRSYSQSSQESSCDESPAPNYNNKDDRVEITKLRLYIKIGLSVIIPCVILLMIVVIYLFIAVHTLQGERDRAGYGEKGTDDSEKELCIECEKLQFKMPTENIILDKLTKKMFGGKQMCCAGTPLQTDIFMERFFKKQIKEERLNGGLCMATSSGLSARDIRLSRSRRVNSKDKEGVRCTDSKNPSVHMIGSKNIGDGKDKGPTVIKSWADNADVAFRNSVKFDHKTGSLSVPKSGFYYVYSQIHFMQFYPRVSRYPSAEQRSINKAPNSNSLTHTIKRFHEHYWEEEMLKRRQSQCWVTNKLYSEYTSYLGGIMNLRMGDEIYVEVSNISMVSDQSRMNFFGMFFVAPSENNVSLK